MRQLFEVEVRRALARRLVRALIALAIAGCAVMSVAVFANAEDIDRVRTLECPEQVLPPGIGGREPVPVCAEPLRAQAVHADGEEPTYLVNLWPKRTDGILLFAGVLLPLGAVVAAASLIGAEWHAGTITTLLTWEPRRTRVLVTKLLAVAVLAFLVSVALQAVFVAAFLPTVFAKGTTAGADAGWFVGLLAAMARIGLVTALAGVLAASLAAIARNTGFAIGVALGYLAVVEPIVRALRPRWDSWFLAENIGRFITARPLSTARFDGSTLDAFLHLALYALAAAAVALWLFRQRDVAGAS